MAGYAMLLASCGACGKGFSSNPLKVPSINNIPFCKQCVDSANIKRVQIGISKIVYTKDAYEPCPEEALG